MIDSNQEPWAREEFADHPLLDYMHRREALRLRKDCGQPWPWSDDEVLNHGKFTNVRREDDRTTRWMRQHWTGPNEDRPPGEILFNCALFRLFGKAEFAAAVGWQIDYDPETVAALARQRRQGNRPVFTGAYTISNGGRGKPKEEYVAYDVLLPLWRRRDYLGRIAREERSWRRVAGELRQMHGFGGTGFVAKEALVDAMQTPVLSDARDRDTWCPIGPGARKGLNRQHGRDPDTRVREDRGIIEMRTLLEEARTRMLPWMPDLELHDIQFNLCELEKYLRAKSGGRLKNHYRRAA